MVIRDLEISDELDFDDELEFKIKVNGMRESEWLNIEELKELRDHIDEVLNKKKK